MLDYLPSVVACCAIYVARKNMGRTCWSPTLEKYTKYHVEELTPCLTEVRSLASSPGHAYHSGVRQRGLLSYFTFNW